MGSSGTISFESKCYPERDFGGYTRVDGGVAFYVRVHALLRSEMTVLDVGCGRGEFVERMDRNPALKWRILKGACKKVIGIDVSDAGRENSTLDEFRSLDSECWPVESASIDLLVSDAVLEHVPNPDMFFAECNRVVKPGGFVCCRTSNRWAYYALIASMIPNRFHAAIISRVQPGRKEEDVFPTVYRANSVRALQRLMRNHNFEGCVYRHIAEPSYFRFSPLLYSIGVHVHRWLPSVFWSELFLFARRGEGE
jgi:ubiquinone/menaquinone biosynthesis C-methylase UbiE